jgi:hypothetical protein
MSQSIRLLFSDITLPLGYGVLLAGNIAFLTLVHFSIDDTNTEDKKLKEIIMILGIYGFLFIISAFGIVWYGILVYFLFLVIIGLAASRFISYEHTDPDDRDEDVTAIKITLTAILFIFISVYFVRSAFPHGWNNLREASYNEFKYKAFNQEESIFLYRQDYVAPITAINVRDPDRLIEDVKKLAKTKSMTEFLASDKLK